MPNYVKNVLTIAGKPEHISGLLEAVKSEDSAFDFEKIIPMPEHIFRGPLSSETEQRLGRENCWYGWSIEHWGTKWNACEASVDGNTIRFETAWNAPEPVIVRLSEKFPGLQIQHDWADEDMGHNLGLRIYQAGHAVSETGYTQGSEIAVRFACQVWGYDYEEYLKELEG